MEAFLRKKILVVEDDPQVANGLSRRLMNANFDVVSTHSGQSAIHYAHSEHPALITLDVLLPDLDGFEVAMQLGHDPDTARIPIIFITGTANRHITENCGRIGSRYFIRKPYDPALLIQLINSLLARDELAEVRRISQAKRRQPVDSGITG
jgi:DNA-binding response OmpR family regulator